MIFHLWFNHKIKSNFHILASLCLSLLLGFAYATWAEGNKIKIEVGQGQLHLSLEGFDMPDAKLKALEAELMVSEDLLPLVTGQEKITLTLEGEAVEKIRQKIEKSFDSSFKGLKALIRAEAKRSSQHSGGLPAHPSDNFESRRVIMGSHAEIKAQESLEEVVVVGGSVDVYGTIERLVVFGGVVNLNAGSRVTEKLVTIGGQVEIDPQASVEGDTVDLSVPLSDSTWDLFRDQLKLLQKKWFKEYPLSWILVISKIIILMIFWSLGRFLSPGYMQRTRDYLAQNIFPSLGWAMLSLLLVLPLTVFLTLSIIGIPLLPLQFSLLALFALCGYLQVAYWLVTRISFVTKWPEWLGVLSGLILLELIKSSGMFGSLFVWLLATIGFGAASKAFSSGFRAKKQTVA